MAGDLRSAMNASERMSLKLEEATKELRAALQSALALEQEAPRGGRDQADRFVKDLSLAVRTLDSLASRARQSLDEASSRKAAHLEAHEKVCSRIDSSMSRVRAALEAAVLLDRVSGSGFNVEVRLNRRLGVRDIVRTLHTAHVQLSRSVRLSRAKASSHDRAVTDLLDETGSTFE